MSDESKSGDEGMMRRQEGGEIKKGKRKDRGKRDEDANESGDSREAP